jgi:hypothetical protein
VQKLYVLKITISKIKFGKQPHKSIKNNKPVINVTKKMKDLYTENYKTLMKKDKKMERQPILID